MHSGKDVVTISHLQFYFFLVLFWLKVSVLRIKITHNSLTGEKATFMSFIF